MIAGIIFTAVLYVGEGILLSYMQYKKQATETSKFEFDWNKILTWPKVLF
jgi:hypothetical protein